jgi:hypothetical protein
MNRTSLLFLLPLSLVSCTHITLLGHESAYDVNAEFSGDPIAPVSLNAGFEGRSFAAVPPKKAVKWYENFDPNKYPEDDAMSSLLELKIEKVPSAGNDAFGNVPFDYVTSGATGLAAEAAAGASPTGSPELETNSDGKSTDAAKEVGKKIKDITDGHVFGS